MTPPLPPAPPPGAAPAYVLRAIPPFLIGFVLGLMLAGWNGHPWARPGAAPSATLTADDRDTLDGWRERVRIAERAAAVLEGVATAAEARADSLARGLVLVPAPPDPSRTRPGAPRALPGPVAAPDTLPVPPRVLALLEAERAARGALRVALDSTTAALSVARAAAAAERAARERLEVAEAGLRERVRELEARPRPRFGFRAGYLVGSALTLAAVLALAL